MTTIQTPQPLHEILRYRAPYLASRHCISFTFTHSNCHAMGRRKQSCPLRGIRADTTSVPDIIELEEGWQSMQKTIAKLKRILEAETEEKIGNQEYMLLYTKIYDMCVQPTQYDYSEQLYNKYKETFDDYCNSKVMPSLRDLRDESLLREFVRRWEIHKVMVRWLSRFFFYLDVYFVRRRSIPTLKEAGLASFRDQVYLEFKSEAANVVIALIDKEREGKKIERGLLKNLIDIYIQIKIDKGSELDCYENDFEAAMLKDTAEYYSRKASDWFAQDTWPDYMLKVEDCLKKEKDCVAHYLHASTETKLLEEVQNQLLVALTPEMLEKKDSGCLELLRDNMVEDLSRMYRLFQKIPQGLENIAKIFKQHVTSSGMALMSQTEDAMSTNKAKKKTSEAPELALVRKVIDLHDRCLGYITGCFSSEKTFHKTLKEAFEAFLDKPVGGTQISEILASYCDDILKKGGVEKLSDDAIEETLDKVIHLVCYISDKDLFAEFCRKKLSRRLLFDKSASEEHEKLLLTKLNQQFGRQLTSKMEGMITDIALKGEIQKKFLNFFNEIYYLGMEFNVTVLTSGFWPTYKSCDLNLPTKMAQCIEVYKDFYECTMKSRKLTWIYSLGTCNIHGNFEQGTIELVVTTLQAVVLLLFNIADKLSYSDIKSQLNLEDDDVTRLLHSLSCAKYKILNKEPNTKTVSRNDCFEFNSKFTDRMRRIRIPLPPADERKKVVEVVEKDRRFSIDAAIVRIMKGRQVLRYQELLAECVQQLSPMFKPDLREIKRRIESLIGQEYIERDPQNLNMFKYVA